MLVGLSQRVFLMNFHAMNRTMNMTGAKLRERKSRRKRVEVKAEWKEMSLLCKDECGGVPVILQEDTTGKEQSAYSTQRSIGSGRGQELTCNPGRR